MDLSPSERVTAEHARRRSTIGRRASFSDATQLLVGMVWLTSGIGKAADPASFERAVIAHV